MGVELEFVKKTKVKIALKNRITQFRNKKKHKHK
jgi:hypothetical protein